jgi:adenosylhomocysteine nucleosidase
MTAKTAFVCAMPLELRPLTRRLALHRHDGNWTGAVAGRPVIATVTGMGTAHAAAGTEAILREGGVEQVISVGITGGLGPTPPIGTLVLPELVVNSATGRTFRPARLGSDEARGIMWTTDRLITSADELAALRDRGVISLDMETAAIAEVCTAHGIPWSVFRVISDRADDGTVNPEMFALSNSDGTPNPRRVARYVLRHPTALPGMAAMGRTVARAADAAARAAIDALAASS